ncbi:tRNA lysidine(34) synthetase TilS [Gallibacterium anatis]|uniref:tRNA lysidine(34) synthetase TilS n=1 Tax=Gallibacterium anatis TaxID=750 RepID=UPI0039FBEAE4
MDLITVLRQQIEQNALQNKAFLVGLSGGVDSTVLLHLFVRLSEQMPLKFRAIHIHHGISNNSDYWLDHCRQLCQQFNVSFCFEKVQIQDHSNIEAQARQARYQAIQQHLNHNEMLVTAHHLDDQSETFLLALKRGSGVKGLAAMPTLSRLFSVPIFRPLLSVTRRQLEQYLAENQLTAIFDESNDNLRYERNFLRHQVLPLLRQRWAMIDQAIVRSAQHCAEQEQLLEELLQPLFQQHLMQDNSLNLKGFLDYSLRKQRYLLRYWFAHLQQPMLSQKQLQVLLDEVVGAKNDRQPELQLNQKVVRRYQQQLYLTPIYQDLRTIKLPIQSGESVSLPDNLGELRCEQQPQQLCFAWQQQQLILPLPQAPYRITVGFHYSKTVKIKANTKHTDIKKVWQMLAVPPWQRNRIPLIFINDRLQGAVGYFINYAEQK